MLNHRSCNFKLCSNRVRDAGKVCLQYRFPRWILPYAFEVTASWHNFSEFGGNWTLRIPKFCGKDFLLEMDRFMRDKSVADILKLMAEFGVRAFDLLKL